MANTNESKATIYCSFCGKSQYQVKKIIAGPTVFICEGCVFTCLEILADEKIAPSEAIAKQARDIQREEAVAGMIRQMKAILKDEAKYHRPYMLLEESVNVYEALEEPLGKSNPATIERFPQTGPASQSG